MIRIQKVDEDKIAITIFLMTVLIKAKNKLKYVWPFRWAKI